MEIEPKMEAETITNRLKTRSKNDAENKSEKTKSPQLFSISGAPKNPYFRASTIAGLPADDLPEEKA